MDELRYDGRVAVVTGGGRGLGRAYCELLAAAGAKVLVNDLGVSMQGAPTEEAPADELVAAIRAAGGEAQANTDTVATPEGGRRIVEQALDTWGRIDILVHNAGTSRAIPLDELTVDGFREVLDVHLLGGFHVLQPAYAAMKRASYGRIVMTASIGGLYGNYGQAPYSAGKAGLIGLSHVAALEGAEHGIKSNCIVPSAVTRMSEGYDTSSFPPLGPEFVAPGVGYLCHESCALSGQMLVALGGRMAIARVEESTGAVQDAWTPAEVGARLDEISGGETLHFPVVPTEPGGPHGFMKHLGASFAMVR